MTQLINILTTFTLVLGLTATSLSTADDFNLNRFDIDGARIGDRQNHFLRDMSTIFPAKTTHARHARSSSLLYKKPISCQAVENGVSRCKGKFTEMQKPADSRQKEFILYRDVVADFNQNSELTFLSTINTTRHKNKKACLKALSKYYKQATSKSEKPSVIYPRNQPDIYYIRIDEQPFATRMVGKLDSAFSMVWQKQRGD